MSLVFIDTNVLIYSHDGRDLSKQQGAAAWLSRCWDTGAGRISSQVMHEFYVNLSRLTPRNELAKVRAIVARYRAWKPWMVDEETVDRAWELQDRFGLNYWDALMLAAAQQLGCAVFLSEDLQHQQRIDSVQVLNPFLAGPETLDATFP